MLVPYLSLKQKVTESTLFTSSTLSTLSTYVFDDDSVLLFR